MDDGIVKETHSKSWSGKYMISHGKLLRNVELPPFEASRFTSKLFTRQFVGSTNASILVVLDVKQTDMYGNLDPSEGTGVIVIDVGGFFRLENALSIVITVYAKNNPIRKTQNKFAALKMSKFFFETLKGGHIESM